jgi:hypothetical protein
MESTNPIVAALIAASEPLVLDLSFTVKRATRWNGKPGDLRAENCFSLGAVKDGERMLTISTSKSYRGLTSRASVSTHKDRMTSHVVALGGSGGDYSKAIITADAFVRGTEKNIKAQHTAALAQIETILDEVRAHYAAKDAKGAA